MADRVIAFAPSTFSRLRSVVVTLGFAVGLSCGLLCHIGEADLLELIAYAAYSLTAAYALARWISYSSVAVLWVGDAKVRVFDGMLKDLGSYSVDAVNCRTLRVSEDTIRFGLELPDVGSVELELQRGSEEATAVLGAFDATAATPIRRSHSILAAAVAIAMLLAPAVVHEAHRLVDERSLVAGQTVFMVFYVTLVAGIVWWRKKTGIRLGRLISRIFL